MRTTILLGTLLFLAGYALAQDSPITVGDTGTQLPPPGQKTGRGAHSTYLQHKHFKGNGDNYFVQDSKYSAACFEVVGVPRPFVKLGQSWTLVLNDGIVLTTTNGNRVDFVYNGKPIDTTAGDTHKAVGDQLTSAWLINGDTATKYTPSAPTPTSGTFQIHYCSGNNCAAALCN